MAQASISLSSRNKFAKRHYEAIALAMQEAMRYARGLDDDLAPGAIQIAIEELADVFDSDNGQFVVAPKRPDTVRVFRELR